MGLAIHPNELVLFFDSTSVRGRKTLAFAQSISENINEKDLSTAKITKTLWHDLLIMLDKQPKEILNKSKPEYQKKIKGHEFDEIGWLNILVHHPELVRAPIAIWHDRAILCERPKDILKLDDHCN